MIKRVSMWKLKTECGQDEISAMRQKLESLADEVAAVASVEVGVNLSTSRSSCDIVFIATFCDQIALREFESHPYHLEVGKYVDSLKAHRYVIVS